MIVNYIDILKAELVPAMGCTEPIAISYCASYAKDILGCLPDEVLIEVSGNIIKNVKSVVVPNTNGQKGIAVAAVSGIIAGDTSKELEVISKISDLDKERIKEFCAKTKIVVKPLESSHLLDIKITLKKDSDFSIVRIQDAHSKVVYVQKNDEVILDCINNDCTQEDDSLCDMSMESIYDYATKMEIDEEIISILERQIEYNMTIAKEGLNNNYGANIGSTLLKVYGDDIKIKAKAMAASGSDARMSGCELPVIINSGSGNQGMTASIPVIAYWQDLALDRVVLYRALLISNLTTIHLKRKIGRLSAYCGAVSAGVGAGCGIAYLLGADFDTICHTCVNGLAIMSGVVCDGAKPSCAAKVAVAVEAGIMGYYMFKEGNEFIGGDGLVAKGVEKTICNIGRLGKEGMKETDKEIIHIMTDC